MAEIATLPRPTDPGTAAIALAAELAKVPADQIRGQGRSDKLVRIREAVALVVHMLSATSDVATPLGRSAGWVQQALGRAVERYGTEPTFKEFVDRLGHVMQAFWLQGRLLLPQAPLPIEHWLDIDRLLQARVDPRVALGREIARAHGETESFALWLIWSQHEATAMRADVARWCECTPADLTKAWLKVNSLRHTDAALAERCVTAQAAYDQALTRVPLNRLSA